MRIYIDLMQRFPVYAGHPCLIEPSPGFEPNSGYFEVGNLADLQSLLETYPEMRIGWEDFNIRMK